MMTIDFSDFEVVSFDIFDTLLHRILLAPVDVFELVQLRAFEDPRSLLNHQHLESFAQSRMRAEANARMCRVAEYGGEGEINLDEIYEQWLEESGATPDLAEWLKALEIDCEARLLHTSAKGKALYDAARSAGCKILFISDMYLPAAFLSDTLAAKGFEDAAKYPLYVSGDVRLSKHMGTLYPHIAEAEGLGTGPHWLHIGDNKHADVNKAGEAGLSAHHASWAKIVNLPTLRRGAYGASNLIESLVAALKEPQARSRMPDDPLERIGYQIWGPMLFGFTCWLIEQLRSYRIQHAVFVARDGWLMLQLFQTCLERLPETQLTSQYFYMSRKTGFTTGVRDWHSERTWYYAAGKSRTTAKRIFSAAGLDAKKYIDLLQSHGVPDIEAVLSEDLKANVVQVLNSVHMDVLQRTAENRKSLAQYYDDTLADRDRVALVDIGWVGNIQRCFLHSLSDPAASARVFGYYLGLHRDHIHLNAELGMSMQGWLNDSDKYEELNRALLAGGVELLEFILTAPHGSTIDYAVGESSISPVLEEQNSQEKEHSALAERAQSGVIRFAEDHAFLLDWLSPETLANPVWADAFLRLCSQPEEEEIQYLAGITHSDGPGTNDARVTLAPKLHAESAPNLTKWKEAREEAFWKAAFDKLNPRPRR